MACSWLWVWLLCSRNSLRAQCPYTVCQTENTPEHLVERTGQVQGRDLKPLTGVSHTVDPSVGLSLSVDDEPARKVQRGDVGQQLVQVRVGYFAKLIPESMLDMSGSVFFSGRRAFNERSDLYILGLNPAGDPAGPHTIRKNVEAILHEYPEDWSAWSS